ncbi:MAG: SDR family NAD(P)-dependent oxidoreductase [Schleiferiaceae bacterium]|jgi:short-subunit dehydrogenase|nr:SDR family NAD(P)-dependent oxidoreductase [Schleiferiaceae bacterium]
MPYALITGGSSGIGLAIAKEMASRNYNLILVSNDNSGLHIARESIIDLFDVQCEVFAIDLTLSDSAYEIHAFCKTKEIDVLVLNAGMYFFGLAVDQDVKQIAKMVQLHVQSPSELSSLFGQEMKQRRSGHILINSSISAFKSFPGIVHYGSTKNYLRALARSLRLELKPYNVNVSCLLPGATNTGLYNADPKTMARASKWGFVMTPENVAKIAVNKMLAKKAMIVPGLLNKLTAVLLPIIPYGLIYLIRKHSSILKE